MHAFHHILSQALRSSCRDATKHLKYTPVVADQNKYGGELKTSMHMMGIK